MPTSAPLHYTIKPSDTPSWSTGRAGRGRGGRPWRRLRERIFQRDNFLCQSCLKIGVVTTIDLHGKRAGVCDHVIPEAEGGKTREDNLQALCKACDKEKTQHESKRGRGL